MVALILESLIDNQNIAWSFRYREPLQSQLQSNPSCSIEERAKLTAVRSPQSAVRSRLRAAVRTALSQSYSPAVFSESAADAAEPWLGVARDSGQLA